jgi:tRNA dimethylallyltransferase
MLYFKALKEGLSALPPGDLAVRARLDARAAVEGWPALHAELARVDPVSAGRLQRNDAQRIQRALEVHSLSGRPLSAWHTDKARPAPPPLISLEPSDRAWLHARIAERFAAMLAAGLVDEVRALRARGDLHPELPAMRAVGYRQTWAALDVGDLASLPAAGTAATRQLAKRQLTWLRAMPARHVVACDAADATEQVVRLAAEHVPP